jgi:predicted Zn-dependent protease
VLAVAREARSQGGGLAQNQASLQDIFRSIQELQSVTLQSAKTPGFLPTWFRPCSSRVAENTDQALNAAEGLLQFVPDDPFGLLLKAQVLAARGVYDEAIVALRKAEKADPNPKTLPSNSGRHCSYLTIRTRQRCLQRSPGDRQQPR